MAKQPAHVFISYSHDSEPHVRSVLELANKLRSEGVNAQLDRFVEAPPEGWPRWVARQIADADFVICVCTAQYRISFEGRNDPEKGQGVNQEGFLIASDLFEHNNRSSRYLTVLFEGHGRGAIPGTLHAFETYQLPRGYEQLYRRVTRQSEVQPVVSSETVLLAPREPAVANLPEKSAGFGGQAEVSQFLTPTRYPIERLAPRDGLYLSRIINPQIRTAHDVITTVWITARGPLDYVVDSIRICDHAWGGLGGNPVVTITPDAEYRFTYAEGSDIVHALNPALAIGPATRNRAWFTLGTAMEKGYYYMGHLFIWAQYQASDGTTGTLFLDELPADGCQLAKLTEADVEFPIVYHGGTDFGQLVITPEGLQRGLEVQHPPEYRYDPVSFANRALPTHGPNRDRLLRARAKCLQALQQCGALNQALKRDSKHEELKNWLAQGSSVAADLLGGMADEESTAILLQEFRTSRADLALAGLCVRHVAVGDELLVRVAGEHEFVGPQDQQLARIIFALMLRPAGEWVAVLLRYQKQAAETVQNILEEMEPELSPEDRSKILAAPDGPLGCQLFVRGTMNNWTTPESARLIYQGDGNYMATLSLEPGSYEFKIGTTNWSGANFGGRQDGTRITAGEQLGLFRNKEGHDLLFPDKQSRNLHLDLATASAAEYRFTVDARNFAMPSLRITPG